MEALRMISSAPPLLVCLAAATSLILLYAWKWSFVRLTAPSTLQIPEAKLKQQRDRSPGEWQPIPPHVYQFPTADEHPTSRGDVLQIAPIQYRPFKWGPKYHITMGLKSLQHAEWFELDSEYPTYQRIRRARLERRGSELLRVLPSHQVSDGAVIRGARCAQGAVELVHAIATYLAQRYPACFALDAHARTITNRVLGEKYGLPPSVWADEAAGRLRDVALEEGEAALRTCALLVPDDLALLTEGADGKYYLQAGAIVIPGTWRLRDKLGMKLEDIHVEGGVPRYEQALRPSMDRYFARLAVDKPVVRVNYGVQVLPANWEQDPTSEKAVMDPDELAWAATTMGTEFPEFDEPRTDADLDAPGHNAPTYGKESTPQDGLKRHAIRATVHPGRLRLRVERQTLRRLPGTGIIVFGIRTYRYAISDIKGEVEGDGEQQAGTALIEKGAAPGVEGDVTASERDTKSGSSGQLPTSSVGARLASAIRSWPDDVRRYKGGQTYGDTLVEYLEKECPVN